MEGRTTISVERSTRDRFHELKPFDSMNADEMLNHLMDSYEEQQSTAEREQ